MSSTSARGKANSTMPLTRCLIKKLNEPDPTQPNRTLLERMVEALICEATGQAYDRYEIDYRTKKKVLIRGHCNLKAIKEIIVRVEGKPSQGAASHETVPEPTRERLSDAELRENVRNFRELFGISSPEEAKAEKGAA